MSRAGKNLTLPSRLSCGFLTGSPRKELVLGQAEMQRNMILLAPFESWVQHHLKSAYNSKRVQQKRHCVSSSSLPGEAYDSYFCIFWNLVSCQKHGLPRLLNDKRSHERNPRIPENDLNISFPAKFPKECSPGLRQSKARTTNQPSPSQKIRGHRNSRCFKPFSVVVAYHNIITS